MAPTIAPEVAPHLARERSFPGPGSARRGGSPFLVFAAIALVLLVGAGIFRVVSKPAATQEKVKVVAAASDLLPGCRLGFTSLHYVDIPEKYVTPDMVTSFDQLAGRTTRQFIAMGEPIRQESLYAKDRGLSLSFDPSLRAITLKLDEDALLDHEIAQGDRVDVLATATGRNGRKYTRTICQQALVLMAVAKEATLSQKLRSSNQDKVTLAVTPSESEKLTEAAAVGKLRLVLLNRLAGTRMESLPGSSESDLVPDLAAPPAETAALPPPPAPFALPPPPPLQPVAQAAQEEKTKTPLEWVVEVFSGSRKETYAFPQAQK